MQYCVNWHGVHTRGIAMNKVSVDAVRDQALALPPLQRIALIDSLVESLDEPDPSIEVLWVDEAHRRLAAFESGEIQPVPMPEALQHYRNARR